MSEDLVPVDSAAVWPEDAQDVTEAIVANWFVREGSDVEEGDTIAEIQIEKVSVDVPAPATGELVERLVDETEEFERGDALARIRPA
ncbi:lipoyl-binding domain protein [Haladaptatus paucihalophilus DX253]|uniref:Biotin-requiring enzyme n=1 Tax=Haladaptatus paucihalophilus DX253 TaxID=797209 RepID=E7R011_HALPU|nr:lipoyl domain-containing protein [Haladaptatus paucihalophilus]EFW89905.1 lipoyl-binding domain protein [Haladaptatus paucihalophilus DX253]SHK57733.1 Biotin-requiring enzyme [Haladaptatus paucihalophilus DX253]